MVYDFTLILKQRDLDDEVFLDLSDRIYGAGCDDSSVSSCEGAISISFDRESESLESAIRSAIAQVQTTGVSVEHVRIEAEAVGA